MGQEYSSEELRVLLLEDTPTDAELAEHELRKAGIVYVAKRVETRDSFVSALEEFRPDIILSDYKLPDFDGMAALQLVQQEHPEIPVIMVTGALPDIEAVELIHAGASDYVLKDRLARLGPAVQRALSGAREKRARREAEIALRESEARYRRITEGLTDYQYTVRVENGRAVETLQSPACATVTGYSATEFSAQPDLWLQMVVPADRTLVIDRLNQILAGKDVAPMEHRIIRKDGKLRWVSDTTILLKDPSGKLLSYDGVIKDITERKQAEAELLRLNRTLRALNAGNHALVHGEDEKSLLENMCKATTEGGFELAWVGYAMQDERKSIVPMAMSGNAKDYVDALNISWDEQQPQGNGPSGLAVRTGQTQISDDISSDPRMAPWRVAAMKNRYASSIALPLKANGKVFGVLSIYANEPKAFGPDQVALLEEMADDLAFGVNALRIRHERDLAMELSRRHILQLQNSLEDTVRAIAGIVEMRDPYTAGHQVRVADLAAAIAVQMGLPDEQVHAIHLAGVVHDLGKIQIPSEILSKPGKISDIEFNLIKTHSQAGYDILKGIQFPWPIAQMVLQHHERLDGTGYPQGLRGDAILLEARILAVADVVEAMYSHRPYRPGLGLDAALAEIQMRRGSGFDAATVDACVTLFRGQKFRFAV